MILATVTSDHLIGYEKVRTRLRELRPHLPKNTTCLRVVQPAPLNAETLKRRTCLPCHREYVTVGAALARERGVSDLALGYVEYQSQWPEQTLYATSRLRDLLRDHGVRLHLPVHKLASRAEAVRELVRLNMSAGALEQKCLQQQWNRELPGDILRQEVDTWEKSTRQQLSHIHHVRLEVISEGPISEF